MFINRGAAIVVGGVVFAFGVLPLVVESVAGQGTPATQAPSPDPTRQGGPGAAGGARGQAGATPAQGRGRGFDLIQEYPADPNEVVGLLNGFKVEIVAKADRPTQGSWI